MRDDTPRSFLDVFEALERNRVRYVVVSGVAVVLRGHCRPVADLDLVVPAEPLAAGHAVRTLQALGFAPSLPLPIHALTVLRMFDASQREVDVFYRYHVPFEHLWAESELLRVAERPLRVAALEHVVQVKRLLGRPHDLCDVRALLEIHR